MLYGVILAGGMGKRLWPESNERTPKPFLCRSGGISLIEETIQHLAGLIPPNRIIISTSDLFVEQTRCLIHDEEIDILSEPVSRNTAAAVALAALRVEARDPNATMVVFPSDAFVGNVQELHQIIETAALLIKEDNNRLITIGIPPKGPETGYGYIKAVTPLKTLVNLDHLTFPPLKADFFCEKPTLQRASEYLFEGGFYWNAGIFVWKAANILNLVSQYLPETAEVLSRRNSISQNAEEIFRKLFYSLPFIPIDKAVLEKVSSERNPEIVLLPAPFAWSDLGTYEELTDLGTYDKDSFGNRSVGTQTVAEDSSDNIIRVSGFRPIKVALAGINKLLIVFHNDTLLVVPQKKTKLIQMLSENKSVISSENNVSDPSIHLRAVNASNNIVRLSGSVIPKQSFTVALGEVNDLLVIIDQRFLFILTRDNECLLPELKERIERSLDLE